MFLQTKRKIFSIIFLLAANIFLAQEKPPAVYFTFTTQADSLLAIKQYRQAAHLYSQAFASFGNKGYVNHRYNAACAYAMSNMPDSALDCLTRIVRKAMYGDYLQFKSEKQFKPLHKTPQWKFLADTLSSINKQNELLGKAFITIKNNRKDSVIVNWLNFSGHEVFYKALAPQTEYRQSTYYGHTWIIRESKTQYDIRWFRVKKNGQVEKIK